MSLRKTILIGLGLGLVMALGAIVYLELVTRDLEHELSTQELHYGAY